MAQVEIGLWQSIPVPAMSGSGVRNSSCGQSRIFFVTHQIDCYCACASVYFCNTFITIQTVHMDRFSSHIRHLCSVHYCSVRTALCKGQLISKANFKVFI